jgi:hypothetical protein
MVAGGRAQFIFCSGLFPFRSAASELHAVARKKRPTFFSSETTILLAFAPASVSQRVARTPPYRAAPASTAPARRRAAQALPPRRVVLV